jgi:hypothetical protein
MPIARTATDQSFGHVRTLRNPRLRIQPTFLTILCH